MSEIQVTARLKIHKGKLTEFKRIAEKCMHSVRTKDSGTLQYDWFFSDDQSECVVLERYRDSQAVLEHSVNLGDTLRELLETCSGSGEVFGSPSPDLMEGLKRIGAPVYLPYQSFESAK
ncbi:MAG: antibiotic biosynthesis monooxygenase [Bryobacteraceae bacterium]